MHFSKSWAVTQKMAHRRTKRTKIWASGGVCSMHVGIFDLEHVKISWGDSVLFSKNWAVTQKRLIVERIGRKCDPRGYM